VRDCFAVAREWVFGFGGSEFGDFSFIDFFGLLDSKACCQCGGLGLGVGGRGWWWRVKVNGSG